MTAFRLMPRCLPVLPRLLMAALFAALLGPLAAPAAALAQKPHALALTPRDRQDVARVEDYLNGIATLTADFLQVDSRGALAQGKVYLERPGRLRFQYDPPVPLEIVANHGWLIYYDSQLKQTSYLPLGSTPLGLLVRPRASLSGDVTITAIHHDPGGLRITLVQTAKPEAGNITLFFTERPMQLVQWVVTDPQGLQTRVTLMNQRLDDFIPSSTFEFKGDQPPAYPDR